MLGVGQLFGTNHACSSGNSGWVYPREGALSANDTDVISISLDFYGASHGVIVTNFDFAMVPDNATITQVDARIEAKDTGHIDFELQLVKDTTRVGDLSDRISPSSSWAVYTKTGDAGGDPLWGTTLTPKDVKSSGFGISPTSILSNNYEEVTLYLDYVQMRVHWSC